ncbi:hypothetical protein SH2C18_32700 [Clostridium sediminicola]|uniref:DUF4870 domain-containing protein n=1 Tax=Clostridium sediminicola TaxID=3114879 RepID=UPI0031F20AEF
MEYGYSTEDKLLAIASHACMFVGGGVIVPLVIFLLVSKDKHYVRENAKQALVSQIFFYASYVIAGILCIILIGFIILPILLVMQVVFTIIAIIKTLDGQIYGYPITKNWAEKL